MSLLVHACIRDENNEMNFVEKDYSDQLAGFESCRQNLYGSAVSKELSLKLLPSLAEGDLYVQFEELQNLKNEVKLMLDNLDLYEKEGFYKRDYIEARLNNVLKAIEAAEKINGWVLIW